MALIMLNGVPYSTPLVEIQNNSSATSLDALKIPTGQTVESYLNNSFYVKAGKKSGTTLGTKATAEGNNNTASGNYSHAEGSGNTASSSYAHAEGNDCIASGFNSHAEGNDAEASGMYTHAEGYSTRASSNYQHVQGKYNIEDTSNKYAMIIGNGTADNARKNAFTVDWDGFVNANQYTLGNSYTTHQINIDTINNVNGYIVRMFVDSNPQGTQPTTVILGNSYLLMGFSAVNTSNNKLYYGTQIAFGFGSSKIAIRNCNYNSTGTGTWSAWAAV